MLDLSQCIRVLDLALGEGRSEVCGQVDVYSFAMVAFEMVSNEIPFRGMSSVQAFQTHTRSDSDDVYSSDSVH